MGSRDHSLTRGPCAAHHLSYSTLAARSEDAVERVAWNRFALPAQDNSGHGTYPNHFRSAPHRSEQGYNGYFNLFDKAGREEHRAADEGLRSSQNEWFESHPPSAANSATTTPQLRPTHGLQRGPATDLTLQGLSAVRGLEATHSRIAAAGTSSTQGSEVGPQGGSDLRAMDSEVRQLQSELEVCDQWRGYRRGAIPSSPD